MPVMAATDEHPVPRLARDASLGEVIEAVNELAAESAKRRYDAARERLDDPHPSASIVISNEAYDALLERLDAPPRPNERLRRTMLGPGA